jgi:hypothetical protein
VKRLHELGDQAGVYGSGRNAATDWWHIKNRPDAVWIADWNGKRSVLNLDGLPNSYWRHKRFHQYEGNVTRTYGGIEFFVDLDSADGPVDGK